MASTDGSTPRSARSGRAGGRPRARPATAAAAPACQTGSLADAKARLMALLELDDISKMYQMGDVEVRALRGVSLRHRAGRVRRDHGRVGLGQVDADEHPRLPRPADAAAATCSTASTCRELRPRRSSPTSATARSASSSRASTCCRAPARSRTSSCRCSTRAWRRASGASARTAALERVGPGRAARPPSEPALRRPAAARGHRARAGRPARRLILADEPTGNLDSRTSVEVMALFQELDRERHHRRAGHPRARHRRLRRARGGDEGRPDQSDDRSRRAGARPSWPPPLAEEAAP